jgi:hypothetical protein
VHGAQRGDRLVRLGDRDHVEPGAGQAPRVQLGEQITDSQPANVLYKARCALALHDRPGYRRRRAAQGGDAPQSTTRQGWTSERHQARGRGRVTGSGVDEAFGSQLDSGIDDESDHIAF